jgi:hypothetical protein
VLGKYNDKVLETTLSELSPFANAFISDTFDRKSGASGASGKTHDGRGSWSVFGLSDCLRAFF